MPLSQIPSPVTSFAVTIIEKPGGETLPTVNLMECAPGSGQGVWAEGQSKVATAEFWPGPVPNVQTCTLGLVKHPSLHTTTAVQLDCANAANGADKQDASRMLM